MHPFYGSWQAFITVGFRPNHTTQDVLVSMTEDWRRAIDRGKLVGAAMVYLSKAFDLVRMTFC